jgi:hypothetical protein
MRSNHAHRRKESRFMDTRDTGKRPTDDTRGALDAWLVPLISGDARVEWQPGGARIGAGPSSARAYSNAQLDDYHLLRPRDFPWRPPLRLRLRAHASHAAWPAIRVDAIGDTSEHLKGTAGFGFWNGAPSIAGGALRPPESIWFFSSSPPSNMALTPGTPGYGWKAQVVHAQRLGALAAVPPMVAGAVWANLSGDERLAARWLNRLTGARETMLDPAADLRDWHEYEIEWRESFARFRVDGREVLLVQNPPRGPLGFVTWTDNQYAIATPRGQLRFGAQETDAQWLELMDVSVRPL